MALNDESKTVEQDLFLGWVSKKGGGHGGRRNWKKRYFRLGADKTFSYYTGTNCKDEKGTGSLLECSEVIILEDNKRTKVVFHTPERTWNFMFESPAEQDYWVQIANNPHGDHQRFCKPSTNNLTGNESHKKKLVVLGDGGVGKSCLTLVYMGQAFVERYDPTIEDIFETQAKVDGHDFTCELMDMAGQEEYEMVLDGPIRDADAFLMVFSINKRTTFQRLQSSFQEKIMNIKELDTLAGFPLVLIGNKCDLASHREIRKEEASSLATQWGCKYIESSAKTKINVNECFEEAMRAIIRHTPQDAEENQNSGYFSGFFKRSTN